LDRRMAELAKPASLRGIVLVGGVLLAVTALVLRGGVGHQAPAITPTAALAALAAHHVEGPVLNDYAFGGYLIFSGIAPFIDGREELYGDAFIKRYVEAMLV